MRNELDVAKILKAYEVIVSNGVKTDGVTRYEGLEAYSDYDGYTVFLRGNGVELSVGFHNTYHFNYDHEHQKESFLKKVEQVLK